MHSNIVRNSTWRFEHIQAGGLKQSRTFKACPHCALFSQCSHNGYFNGRLINTNTLPGHLWFVLGVQLDKVGTITRYMQRMMTYMLNELDGMQETKYYTSLEDLQGHGFSTVQCRCGCVTHTGWWRCKQCPVNVHSLCGVGCGRGLIHEKRIPHFTTPTPCVNTPKLLSSTIFSTSSWVLSWFATRVQQEYTQQTLLKSQVYTYW